MVSKASGSSGNAALNKPLFPRPGQSFEKIHELSVFHENAKRGVLDSGHVYDQIRTSAMFPKFGKRQGTILAGTIPDPEIKGEFCAIFGVPHDDGSAPKNRPCPINDEEYNKIKGDIVRLQQSPDRKISARDVLVQYTLNKNKDTRSSVDPASPDVSNGESFDSTKFEQKESQRRERAKRQVAEQAKSEMKRAEEQLRKGFSPAQQADISSNTGFVGLFDEQDVESIRPVKVPAKPRAAANKDNDARRVGTLQSEALATKKAAPSPLSSEPGSSTWRYDNITAADSNSGKKNGSYSEKSEESVTSDDKRAHKQPLEDAAGRQSEPFKGATKSVHAPVEAQNATEARAADQATNAKGGLQSRFPTTKKLSADPMDKEKVSDRVIDPRPSVSPQMAKKKFDDDFDERSDNADAQRFDENNETRSRDRTAYDASPNGRAHQQNTPGTNDIARGQSETLGIKRDARNYPSSTESEDRVTAPLPPANTKTLRRKANLLTISAIASAGVGIVGSAGLTAYILSNRNQTK